MTDADASSNNYNKGSHDTKSSDNHNMTTNQIMYASVYPRRFCLIEVTHLTII